MLSCHSARGQHAAAPIDPLAAASAHHDARGGRFERPAAARSPQSQRLTGPWDACSTGLLYPSACLVLRTVVCAITHRLGPPREIARGSQEADLEKLHELFAERRGRADKNRMIPLLVGVRRTASRTCGRATSPSSATYASHRIGAMDVRPGARLGPYEILTAIGAGGMGSVYRARDTRLGRDVAIKFTSEEFSDRFTREARAESSKHLPAVRRRRSVPRDGTRRRRVSTRTDPNRGDIELRATDGGCARLCSRQRHRPS